ncbi:single-stranded DNA-binding protein [Aquifex aeolicus]|uniref:Single-stranded DNA-binding protein n=1 Tax=Aquifex aeolicus (strain VF5) TaxID=224324 RepID=SSB_AQUAE|nr:single-stranded DNA-binding protein [Aquifex aeolicus]O66475.1 RecName: Full=Single-stranded DNA-binding protein; Short=SSB [Aquifex aeolicus VF5]AAC06439.1 single stranded DNA-binding protein [Aquifex aeolicus VF5]
MLNKVFIIGRLTGDPVITYLPSGTPVVEFTLAYNRRYKNQNGEFQEESHFFDVKAYGKMAEDWATRFSKGYLVLVEGRLSQEKWEKEGKKFSKVRIIAENVRLINRPKGAELQAEEEEEVPPIEEEIEKLGKEEEKPFTDEEDEIPF